MQSLNILSFSVDRPTAMVKERKQRVGKKTVASKVNRGTWTADEDQKLVSYVATHGDKHWTTLPAKAGLKRSGKSCRLRWLNYLRPDIKRGNISEDEEDLIIRLHNLLGNRWSIIAGRIPGRTDNEIKNHWNTHLRKKSLSIEDLNNKQNMQYGQDNVIGTVLMSPPRAQREPNNSSNGDVSVPSSTLRPADESRGPAILISQWMEQAASEFDIERLFIFGSEFGLDDFGLPPSHHHHENNGNQDKFFEFEDLELWLDQYQ